MKLNALIFFLAASLQVAVAQPPKATPSPTPAPTPWPTSPAGCLPCAAGTGDGTLCKDISDCRTAEGTSICVNQGGSTKICKEEPLVCPHPTPPTCASATKEGICVGFTSGCRVKGGFNKCYWAGNPAGCVEVIPPTCEVTVADEGVYTSKASNLTYAVTKICGMSGGQSFTCDIYQNMPSDVSVSTYEGTCLQDEQCEGSNGGSGNKPLGSRRMTICHRTCSKKNPWVRITIDDDAWNGSGCGHQLQHEVLFRKDKDGNTVEAECHQTITKETIDRGLEPTDANLIATRESIWGYNDKDYLLLDHGENSKKVIQNKTYWKYWEPACPYVRKEDCCDWDNSQDNCCGAGIPTDPNEPPQIPVAKILLEKISCSKNVNSCDKDTVDAALLSGDCDLNLYTGYSGDEAMYCYRVTNDGADPVCDMEMTDLVIATNPGLGADGNDAERGVVKPAPASTECLAAGATMMWPSGTPSTIPEPNVIEAEVAVVTGLKQGAPAGTARVWDEDISALAGVLAGIQIKKYACPGTVGGCSAEIASGICVDETLYKPQGSAASYCYVVTNNQATTLCEVNIVDPASNGGYNGLVTGSGMPEGCISGNEEVVLPPQGLPTIQTPEYFNATVTGYPYDSSGVTKLSNDPVTDSDPAGVDPTDAVPIIYIKKYACPDQAGKGVLFDCETALTNLGTSGCEDDTLYVASGDATVFCFSVENPNPTTKLCEVTMVDDDGKTYDLGCLEPSEQKYPEANPKTDVTSPTGGNATVTGTPYNDAGTEPTGGDEVKDFDPAVVEPVGQRPEISIKRYSCKLGDGSVDSFDCATAIDSQLCEDDMLYAPTGTPSTYCVKIKNTGDTTLCKVTMTDSNFDNGNIDLSGQVLPGGGCELPLKPGDVLYKQSPNFDLNESDYETATVEGVPTNEDGTKKLPGEEKVESSDPSAVTPSNPDILLEKFSCHDIENDGLDYDCASNVATAHCNPIMIYGPVGSKVAYCFKAENKGDTNLCELALTEGAGNAIAMPEGCLPAGGVVYGSPKPFDLLSVENTTATITGTPSTSGADPVPTGGPDVTSTDFSGVTPASPGISVEKFSCYKTDGNGDPLDCESGIPSASCFPDYLFDALGTEVFYCYKLTNTGDTSLCEIMMTDLSNGYTPLGSSSPDVCLEPGISIYPPPNDHTITGKEYLDVEVSARPYKEDGLPNGQEVVTDKDPSGVASPEILITKTVCSDPTVQLDAFNCAEPPVDSTCVHDVMFIPTGTNAVYCFEVENPPTTLVTLCDVAVTDPGDASPRPVGSGSAEMPPGCLLPGDKVFVDPKPFVVGDPEYLNATVTGTPCSDDGSTLLPDSDPVTDEDPAGVDPAGTSPSILIKKYSCPGASGLNCEAAIGDLGASGCVDEMLDTEDQAEVVYCFNVTNTGDSNLCEIIMSDTSNYGDVTHDDPLSDGIDCLAPDDSWYPPANALPQATLVIGDEYTPASVTGVPYNDAGDTPSGVISSSGETFVESADSSGVQLAIPVPVPPTDAPVAPTDAPVAPTDAPVAPTEAPVAPTDAPVAPTDAPVAPTDAPVAPTEAPVAPTDAPVAPTDAPVAPTDAPVAPTDAPVAPTDAPVAPTDAPVAPTDAPVAPTDAPVAPTDAPVAPTDAPVAPTDAPVAPTDAPVAPTDAPVSPTDPAILLKKYACPSTVSCSDDVLLPATGCADENDATGEYLLGDIGMEATYCFSVSNTGDEDLCGITMTDPNGEWNEFSTSVTSVGAIGLGPSCLKVDEKLWTTDSLVQPFPSEEGGEIFEYASVLGTGVTSGKVVTSEDPAGLKTPISVVTPPTELPVTPPPPPGDCVMPEASPAPCPDLVEVTSIDGDQAAQDILNGMDVIYDITFEGNQVKFKVLNPFAGDTDVFIVFHQAIVGHEFAYQEACAVEKWASQCPVVTPVGENVAECSSTTGVSWASIYFVTNANDVSGNAVVDECCDDAGVPPAGSTTIRYTVLIKCGCPDAAQG